MKPIDIPRRSHLCALGNEPLKEGTTYYSLLEEGAQEMIRRDYCPLCWEKVSAKGDSMGHRAFWKSKILPKKREAHQVVDFSHYAFLLLQEALQHRTEEAQEEAFVLALYLARKRQLLLRQEIEREPGERYFLYEVAATEEMLAVKKLDLSKVKTEKVQDNLARKFSSCSTS